MSARDAGGDVVDGAGSEKLGGGNPARSPMQTRRLARPFIARFLLAPAEARGVRRLNIRDKY